MPLMEYHDEFTDAADFTWTLLSTTFLGGTGIEGAEHEAGEDEAQDDEIALVPLRQRGVDRLAQEQRRRQTRAGEDDEQCRSQRQRADLTAEQRDEADQQFPIREDPFPFFLVRRIVVPPQGGRPPSESWAGNGQRGTA